MRPPLSALPPGRNRSPVDAAPESADPNKPKDDPGVPPSAPPSLLTMRELDSDYESEVDEDAGEQRSAHNSTDQSSSDSDDGRQSDHSDDALPKPTSVQQRILAIAGQKYDDFMKELENVHKKKSDLERSRADERASVQGDADNEPGRRGGGRLDDNRRNDGPHPLGGADNHSHSVPPPMPRKDNPVMIPNNAAFPAPPMAPPPFTSKMPGLPPPPPPPMGAFSHLSSHFSLSPPSPSPSLFLERFFLDLFTLI